MAGDPEQGVPAGPERFENEPMPEHPEAAPVQKRPSRRKSTNKPSKDQDAPITFRDIIASAGSTPASSK